MDVELIDRLIDWLAFFLSQQDFGWDWDSWTFVSDLPNYNTQKVFVKNLLTKCCNLTDSKTFIENLPDQLEDLISVNKRGEFKYINENKDNYDAQIILDAMSSRDSKYPNSLYL